MSPLAPYIEIRRHPRAQLQLPVRVRWRGPIGMRLETTQTIDVSREGLFVLRAEPCELHTRVWVAFPFDSSVSMTGQPETPARVVRVEKAARGGCRVALHLELPPRVAPRPPGNERRSSPRIPFALPIFVRAAGAPWPEESMTQDISRGGARFLTARIFAEGDAVAGDTFLGRVGARGRNACARGSRDAATRIHLDRHRSPIQTNGLSALLTSVAVHWEKPAKA